MKKLMKTISVTAVLALAAAALAGCGGAQSKVESAASAAAGAVESAASAAAGAVESAASAVESAVADLSKVDVTIEDGDYAAMEAFAKELQNGGNVGKVVKVTGTSTRSNFGAKASVMVSNGEGEKIGTTYIITGVDAIDGYPQDDAVIQITGVVTKSDNGISCHIEVPADQVVTK